MESYSPFFQTLHDERSPTGHLGNGTHSSILRAMVFQDPTFLPLTTGAFADFAVIWDEDHDTRVIKAVELIYRAGFLGSILMIGERKGTLHAIVSEDVKDPKILSSLEDELRLVAQRMEDDPWSSSVRTLDSPDHEIIDDESDKVSLYLRNLKMLWKLGLQLTTMQRLKLRRAAQGIATLSDLTDEQIVAVVKSIAGNSKEATLARAEALWNLGERIKAEKERKVAEAAAQSKKIITIKKPGLSLAPGA